MYSYLWRFYWIDPDFQLLTFEGICVNLPLESLTSKKETFEIISSAMDLSFIYIYLWILSILDYPIVKTYIYKGNTLIWQIEMPRSFCNLRKIN